MPEWSPSGQRIYFRGPNKREILVADVVSEEPLAFGPPRLFVKQSFRSSGIELGASYDVRSDKDGDEVVLLKSIHGELETEFATKVTVLVHFDQHIARLAAATGGGSTVAP